MSRPVATAESLFLPGVLSRHRFDAGIDMFRPLPDRWLTGFVLGVAMLVVLLVAFGRYAPVVTARGEVVGRETTVRPPFAGIVRNVQVVEGQVVRPGQPLLEIYAGGVDGASTSEFNALRAQQQALYRQRVELSAAHDAAANSIGRRLGGARDMLARERQRWSLEADSYRLAATAMRRLSRLVDRGVVPRAELEQQKVSLLRSAAALYAAEQGTATQRIAVAELLAEQDALGHRQAEAMARLDERVAAVAGLLARYLETRQRVLRAPVGGRISLLDVHPGQAADANAVLLKIQPLGRSDEGRLIVADRALTRLEPGQRLELAFDAYPMRRHGTVSAEVTDVAVSPREPGLVSPVLADVPRYVVRVRLEATGGIVPRSGMRFTADIAGRPERIIHWLLEPVSRELARLNS